jgi:hypothetical protein
MACSIFCARVVIKQDPAHLLRKIEPAARAMILHMMQIRPDARWSAQRYLDEWCPHIFPSYFPYLYRVFATVARPPLATPDDKIRFLNHSFEDLVEQLVFGGSGSGSGSADGDGRDEALAAVRPGPCDADFFVLAQQEQVDIEDFPEFAAASAAEHEAFHRFVRLTDTRLPAGTSGGDETAKPQQQLQQHPSQPKPRPSRAARLRAAAAAALRSFAPSEPFWRGLRADNPELFAPKHVGAAAAASSSAADACAALTDAEARADAESRSLVTELEHLIFSIDRDTRAFALEIASAQQKASSSSSTDSAAVGTTPAGAASSGSSSAAAASSSSSSKDSLPLVPRSVIVPASPSAASSSSSSSGSTPFRATWRDSASSSSSSAKLIDAAIVLPASVAAREQASHALTPIIVLVCTCIRNVRHALIRLKALELLMAFCTFEGAVFADQAICFRLWSCAHAPFLGAFGSMY